MSERYVSDLKHCEYRVFVEGPALTLDAALAKAVKENGALDLGRLAPPPDGLKDVDPLSLAHFHMLYGDEARARDLYTEMDLPYPQVTAGKGISSESVAPEALSDAVRVSRNVQKYGAASTRDWKRERWGTPIAPSASYERVAADAVVMQWSSEQSTLALCHSLAAAFPTLTVGVLHADFGSRTQSWFLRLANEPANLQVNPKGLEQFPEQADFVTLYLDNPPTAFQRAG
jgi:hypothetical protein